MPETHYIKAGWLIDGSGGPVRKNVLLTIDNGIFTNITNRDDSPAADPGLVTNLSHCTILPPLIDSHVYLALSSIIDDRARKKQLKAPYEEICGLITQNIQFHFSHGILGLRDGGDGQGHVLRYKADFDTGTREPVVVKTPGYALSKKGRYGAEVGKQIGEGCSLIDSVARETESSDYIKIINSDPIRFGEFDKETLPQFTQDEVKQVVIFAKQNGKKIVVQANGKIPVSQALEAGCDAIEQGYGMGGDNLGKMAEKDVLWIPNVLQAKNSVDTSSTSEGIGCRFSTRYVAQGKPVPGAEDFWKKMLIEQLKQLRLARKLGVTTATGTGAGSAGILHGESMVEEMKLFIKAGYSLEETIQCVSKNGAKLLGIENKMGIIAIGRPANFLVTRGTPAQLPRKLSLLEDIYLNGAPCNKEFFGKV